MRLRSADHIERERPGCHHDRACARPFFSARCRVGRPSLAPGRYVRMLLLGYVEGLDSERAIAWRVADSLSLRQFLDIALHEAAPDHSTVSRTRRRIELETHQAVFTWVPQRLADAGLVRGKTASMRRRWKPTQRCGASCAGTRARATKRSCAGWPRPPVFRHRRAPSWPASTPRARRRGPTTIGRIRRTRTRRSPA